MTIYMISWREGLHSIELVMLQVNLLRLGLKAAKENVDRLIANYVTPLNGDNDLSTREFVLKAHYMGVVFDRVTNETFPLETGSIQLSSLIRVRFLRIHRNCYYDFNFDPKEQVDELIEDMFQAVYRFNSKTFCLDIGWYGIEPNEFFRGVVIYKNDWENPEFTSKSKDLMEVIRELNVWVNMQQKM